MTLSIISLVAVVGLTAAALLLAERRAYQQGWHDALQWLEDLRAELRSTQPRKEG